MLENRGKAPKTLWRWAIEGADAPALPAEIRRDGTVAGEITSASPAGEGSLALGYLKRDYFEPGTEVSVLGHPGRVSSLPFQI